MHIGFAAIESPFDKNQRGGIASYFRVLLPELLAAGHEISFFAPSAPPASRHPHLHFYTVKLPNLHWYLSRIPLLGSVLAHPVRQIEWSFCFYRAFKKHGVRPDVIECGETGGFFLHKIAPLIVRLHGSDYIFRKKMSQTIPAGLHLNHCLEKKIYHNAAALSAPSRAQAAAVSEDSSRAAGKMHVAANPVDLSAFSKISGMAKTNPQKPVIFYNGRIAPVKGVDVLMKAFAVVRKKFPEARLILSGRWQMPGPPSAWGLETDRTNDGVEWAGPADAEQVRKFYEQSDIFIMPSYFETFGISLAEAMAAGMACVVSKAGGLAEIVEDGVSGIFVPPGNPEAMAAAIIRLLENPEARKKLGEAARKKAETSFDPARAAGELAALYEKTGGKR